MEKQSINGRYKALEIDSEALDGQAGPDGLFVSTGACNLGVPGLNPGRDVYLSSMLYIYSAPNCSKAWSVQCCLWYCAL